MPAVYEQHWRHRAEEEGLACRMCEIPTRCKLSRGPDSALALPR